MSDQGSEPVIDGNPASRRMPPAIRPAAHGTSPRPVSAAPRSRDMALAAASKAPGGIACPCRCANGGRTWYAAIPGRIWFALGLLAMPFRVAGWVLETMVAAAVVGILATAYLWWTHVIPDEQVAAFLGQIGARGLGILGKSGVL